MIGNINAPTNLPYLTDTYTIFLLDPFITDFKQPGVVIHIRFCYIADISPSYVRHHLRGLVKTKTHLDIP